MLITSLDNDRIKSYIKLKDRKYRKKTKTFIVEGMHLVLEAYKSGNLIELILEKDEVLPIDVPTIYVTNEIINKISSLDNPSNVMGLCKMNDNKEVTGNKILLLDGVQDPGNLGTIIRSSLAFNVDTIVTSLDTVDLYNPKVLRSTQGMIFHLNIVNMDLKEAIAKLKKELGKDYVILFRAHYFIANSFDFNKYKDFVYNVSDYDDINDLYIISDLLITDYSSVFFDYAILKRPILFYMYDYKNYKTKLRDFYLDLKELPGPIIEKQEDLIKNIKQIDKVFNKYKKYYQTFNKKFNPYEDGKSSIRVAKEIIK